MASPRKRRQQTEQQRASEIPPSVKRDAQAGITEWGYLKDAAGALNKYPTECLLLNFANFTALKPTEIGAFQMKDLRSRASTEPGIDIWHRYTTS
jgi:hypothetical protein